MARIASAAASLLCLVALADPSARPTGNPVVDRAAEGTVSPVAGDETDAIQRRIDCVSRAGGGRVAISGGIHRIRPLELKKGVELHLEDGAVLLGSGDWRDYPDRPLRHAESTICPRGRSSALIWADEADGIKITGAGRIDANGASFLREATAREREWGYSLVRKGGMKESPPRVVLLAGCRNVQVADVEMVGLPGGWAFWVHDCDDVLFDNVRISADVQCANNDGIHVNSSRDVTIRRCDITTGDDAIVVRANNRSLRANKVCERVTVTNCTLHSWSSGIRIGWANDGTIRNCRFADIRMHDTSYGIAIELPARIHIPSDYGREATRICGLTFEDIDMDGIYAHPLLCTISEHPSTLCDGVSDLAFRRVRARSLQMPHIQGRPISHFERFVFEGCRFEKVGDDILRDSDRHGAASKGRRRTESFTCATGFTFDGAPVRTAADFGVGTSR